MTQLSSDISLFDGGSILNAAYPQQIAN